MAARRSASRSSSGDKARTSRDTSFARRVLTIVGRVPVGRVVTYGTVARLAGRPRAARAVGNLMRTAHVPGLPYHRVVAAGGRLGGYSNLALKRQLLQAEGVVVSGARIKQLERVLWEPGTRASRRGS